MKETIEKHQFKITVGTAIVAVAAIVTFSLNINTRFDSIDKICALTDARIEVIEAQGIVNKEKIVALELKANQADLDRIKIITKLESIELSILELKETLKGFGN